MESFVVGDHNSSSTSSTNSEDPSNGEAVLHRSLTTPTYTTSPALGATVYGRPATTNAVRASMPAGPMCSALGTLEMGRLATIDFIQMLSSDVEQTIDPTYDQM